MTSGSFSILASNTAFVGGSEATFSLPGTKTNNNLVGCLKKVSTYIFFLSMAKKSNEYMLYQIVKTSITKHKFMHLYKYVCKLALQIIVVALVLGLKKGKKQ